MYVCGCGCSLESQIQASVQELGSLLGKIKGSGQVQPNQKAQVQEESDIILRPLMDLLDGQYVGYCTLRQ